MAFECQRRNNVLRNCRPILTSQSGFIKSILSTQWNMDFTGVRRQWLSSQFVHDDFHQSFCPSTCFLIVFFFFFARERKKNNESDNNVMLNLSPRIIRFFLLFSLASTCMTHIFITRKSCCGKTKTKRLFLNCSTFSYLQFDFIDCLFKRSTIHIKLKSKNHFEQSGDFILVAECTATKKKQQQQCHRQLNGKTFKQSHK